MFSVNKPFAVKGLMLDIGPAWASPSRQGRSRDAANLIRHADMAMYVAKEPGEGFVTTTPPRTVRGCAA